MPDYILLSEKSWHKDIFTSLQQRSNESWHYFSVKENFNLNEINKIHPLKIFIPHWSYIIPAEIYETYECVVFHMTDLPYGRGGSPLQNLIERDQTNTMISALKVQKGIDTGDIYLKKELELNGSAGEIFLRSVPVIHQMIEEIIDQKLLPFPQQGEVVTFKRRKPEESNIEDISGINKLYDHIRMLDAETYPKAFLENENFRMEFFNAQKNENEIIAHVRITKK
jgi:methionyl-tRNA formyltransferase